MECYNETEYFNTNQKNPDLKNSKFENFRSKFLTSKPIKSKVVPCESCKLLSLFNVGGVSLHHTVNLKKETWESDKPTSALNPAD